MLERSLYNGALDGLSLSGDRFFYDNVLASNGQNARREWFGTACCPANIARLVASLGNYVYGANDGGIWVNLFIANDAKIDVAATGVSLKMETGYPWDGKVRLSVGPAQKKKFAVHIRVPGWLTSEPALGGLYRFTDSAKPFVPAISVNGKPFDCTMEKGYAVVEREWGENDIVEWNFPMPARKIVAGTEVAADRGKIALQRGPLVYCVEGADNSDGVWNIVVPEESRITEVPHQVLTEQVVALQLDALSAHPSPDGKSVAMARRTVTAIPYYTWANRGGNAMQVWLPTKVTSVRVE